MRLYFVSQPLNIRGTLTPLAPAPLEGTRSTTKTLNATSPPALNLSSPHSLAPKRIIDFMVVEESTHNAQSEASPSENLALKAQKLASSVKPDLAQALVRRWLEQLQSLNSGQPTWVQLPAHNGLCFELLFYQGRFVFAPSREERLFLDYQFRRQAPALTRKMRDLFMSVQPEHKLNSLFEWTQLGTITPEERSAMTEQLWRLLQQSAALYGVRRGELFFEPAPELRLNAPVSFSLEELLPRHGGELTPCAFTAIYDQLAELTDHSCLLFSRAERLSWDQLLMRPEQLCFAQAHALMDLYHDKKLLISRWTGMHGTFLATCGSTIYGAAISTSRVLLFQAPLVRLGRITALLQGVA